MNLSLPKAEIQWTEPRIFYNLKRKVEKRDKPIIKRIGIRSIIAFFFFFILVMLVRLPYVLDKTHKIGLLGAMLISALVSICFIYLIYLGDIFCGIQVKFFKNYIYIRKEFQKYWKYKNIRYCKVLQGIYKKREYTAFEIWGSKGLLGTIFLSDEVSLEKIKDFLEKKGIECQ